MNTAFTVPPKLKTCRYWALGPHCPNILNGVSYCEFAHRITAFVASPVEQTGTCINFIKAGVCPYGSRCHYEHRQCGVTGIGQGIIELHGLEFEIASAAFQAGFNTANHEALFNLIWVLKRAGDRCFGSSGETRLPSKHPIYPDRYRPSGFGDNTTKKRKLSAVSQLVIDCVPEVQEEKSKHHPIGADDVLPRPEVPVKTLTSNQTSTQESAKKTVTSTQESAKAVTRNQASAKAMSRVKFGLNGGIKDQAMSLDKFAQKYTPWNVERAANAQTRKTGSNGLELGRPNRLLEKRKQSQTLPIRLSQQQQTNKLRSGASPVADVSMSRWAEEEIVEALVKVNTQLTQTKNAMNGCQEDMRKMFDRYPDQLRDEQKTYVLRSLAKDMDNVWEAAKAGMSDVEKMLSLMEKRKDSVEGI